MSIFQQFDWTAFEWTARFVKRLAILEWKELGNAHVFGELGCECGALAHFTEGNQLFVCLDCGRRYWVHIQMQEVPKWIHEVFK